MVFAGFVAAAMALTSGVSLADSQRTFWVFFQDDTTDLTPRSMEIIRDAVSFTR